MKTKVTVLITAVVLLSMLLGALPASAALPPNLSWVKYASNPVAPAGLCGVTQPFKPAIVWESANNYKMYFSPPGGTDGAQIFLATTTDGGINWTCANLGLPVLTLGAPGTWDGVRVVGPTVINDGGTYKMWYGGRDASANWSIGYATSPDGITWTKDVANPVLQKGSPSAWDSQYVREPSVVKVGTVYHMWYTGTANHPYTRIGHATSNDGTTWVKDTANPVLAPTAGAWDSGETYGPSVVMNGAVFEMFYSGSNSNRWLLGHASSADGTVWTRDANAIISPSVTGWDNGDSTDYAGAVLDGSDWKLFYSGANASSNYRIGLATLTNQAQLSFRPLGASVAIGGSQVVTIDLTGVTNLYGYQFEVHYDAAKVTAVGAFLNSFFDTTAGGAVPPGWDGTCAAGVCKFAATKVGSGLAVSGSGPVAQVTLTGTGAGLFPLTFGSDILSIKDGFPIVHTSTVAWMNVYGTATISGQVALQGRTSPIDAGTVTLLETNGIYPAMVVPFNDTTGNWTATVPANGTYTALASHLLYLSNQTAPIAVTAGSSYPQALTTLKGGDADDSGAINITDLSTIGSAFGGTPSGGIGTGADINHDNVINILDLVLAGGNFGLASPQPW